MDKIEKGFTLIEMMVAITVSTFIIGISSVSLQNAGSIYQMVNARNELMSKVTPMISRIEGEMKEGAPASVIGVVRGVGFVQGANATYSGVIVNTRANIRYIYWWDRNGNGDVISGPQFFLDIGNPVAGTSVSIYRAEVNTGTTPWSIRANTTVPIVISRGTVPTGPLQFIYNGQNAWSNMPVTVTDFRITFLTTDANQRTTKWIHTPATPNFNTISYMKIEITTMGAKTDDIQTYTSGFQFN